MDSDLATVTTLPPLDQIGFGKVYGPKMIKAETVDGKWTQWEMCDVERFQIHPGAKVLHYSQEVFEGMKAYKHGDQAVLFRPDSNIKRMSFSSEKLAMLPFPEDEFLLALKTIVAAHSDFIPEEPGSLYLRPTLIGTSTSLGVAPAEDYIFYILVSPVGGYFGSVNSDKPATVRIRVAEEHVRAVRGGVGSAKTGGNYAASLQILKKTRAEGFNDCLFLDAIERRYIEELSGMNVMIVEDGVLKTPPLSDTILAGVTRDTLLKLAEVKGIATQECLIDINELFKGIQEGRVTEMFACGTAAVITSFESLTFKGQELKISNGQPGKVACELYQYLSDIHRGRVESPNSDWIVKI